RRPSLHLMPGAAGGSIVLAGRLDRAHLDECDQELCALADIGGFEQRLLLARRKGARHCQRGDEILARRLADRLAIGRDLALREITLQPADQPLAGKMQRSRALATPRYGGP